MNLRSLFRQIVPKQFQYIFKNIYFRRKISLSQMGQDFWVYGEVFNRKLNGYFVEIGSYDGITLNNTFLLEKIFFWKGICIEPNPETFYELKKIRESKCLNICVDSGIGEIEFIPNMLSSGIISRDTDNSSYLNCSKSIKVLRLETMPLIKILKDEEAPKIIDYLSIDVEGAEDRILCDFPFDEYRFLCMTIERPKATLRDVLAKNGYLVIKEIPNYDVFYIHESFLEEYKRNMFNFWTAYYK